MRYRVIKGGSAYRFAFDRKPSLPSDDALQLLPRAAELDNPYGLYYSKPRSREQLCQQRLEQYKQYK